MVIKAAIFDLDGTLLDSTGIWRRIDEVFLGKRGLAVPDDYFFAVSTMNLTQGAAYTIQRFGLSESESDVIAEWHTMASCAYAQTIPMKPGATPFLRLLSGHGIKLALATASPPDYYIPALKRCGIYTLFDLFVHSRPGLYKGGPEFYLHCAEKLKVPPSSCAVFEDVYDGVRAAKQAGMVSVAVADPQSAAKRAEIAALADCMIDTFETLPPAIFTMIPSAEHL